MPCYILNIVKKTLSIIGLVVLSQLICVYRCNCQGITVPNKDSNCFINIKWDGLPIQKSIILPINDKSKTIKDYDAFIEYPVMIDDVGHPGSIDRTGIGVYVKFSADLQQDGIWVINGEYNYREIAEWELVDINGITLSVPSFHSKSFSGVLRLFEDKWQSIDLSSGSNPVDKTALNVRVTRDYPKVNCYTPCHTVEYKGGKARGVQTNSAERGRSSQFVIREKVGEK